MTATLHLGVIDHPYASAEGQTTGDVAEYLENKYHIYEIFFREREQEIAKVLLESVEGALADFIRGTPIKDILQRGLSTQRGSDLIKNMFMDFIDSGAMERLGYPGVPTKAAMEGISYRLKGKKGGRRVSFRDTGNYEEFLHRVDRLTAMSLSEQIKIDVDSASFSAFFTKFLEFKASLENTPEAWRNVASSASVARKEIEKVAKSAHDHAEAISGAAASTSKLQQSTNAVGRTWNDISKSTGTAAKNIAGMTVSLLKWAGVAEGLVGAAAGGVLGVAGAVVGVAGAAVGGIVGSMPSIANRVTQERRQALTAGSTIGNARAADLSYSRFLGGAGSGAAFGQRIADMQRSSEGRTALARLLPGMSQDQIANMDPYDLEGALIQAGHQYAKNVPRGQLYNTPALAPFDRGALNIIAGNQIEESEYGAARQTYAQNKGALNPSQPRAWADFEQVLTTAKGKIETTFIDRLTQLDGPIGRIVTDFSNVAVKLINSDAFGDFIKRLNEGAEWLAKEVDTPQFRQEIDSFIGWFGTAGSELKGLATGLVSFARWLGIGVPSAGIGASPSVAGGGGSPSTAGGGSSPSSAGGGATSATGAASSGGRPSPGSGAVSATGSTNGGSSGAGSSQHLESLIRSSAEAHGVDPDQAMRVARSEGFPWKTGDYGTSFGSFQNHFASNIPGMRSQGLGDLMAKQGINARDPSQAKSIIDFDMQYASEHGWSAWHGWRGSPMAGIGTYHGAVEPVSRDAGSIMSGDAPPGPHDSAGNSVKVDSSGYALDPATGRRTTIGRRANAASALPFFASTARVSVTSMPGANPFVSAAQSGNLNGALQ